MQNVVFTQLSIPEVRQLLREELDAYFTNRPSISSSTKPDLDGLLTIQQAAGFLHLSVATLYGKVHAREIPFSKQGKRLYFSKAELSDWVKSGRRKTHSELTEEAQQSLTRKRK